MKRKALVVALLCVMGLAAIFNGNAEAAATYTCTVSQVASNWYTSYVVLSDTGAAFTDTQFVIDATTGHSKEMLAVFLTAWANSSNVSVYLGGTTNGSTVWGVAAVK